MKPLKMFAATILALCAVLASASAADESQGGDRNEKGVALTSNKSGPDVEKEILEHAPNGMLDEKDKIASATTATDPPQPPTLFDAISSSGGGEVKSLEPQVLSPSTIASPNATVRLVAVIVEKPEKVVTQPPTEPAVNEEEMSQPSYATSDVVSQSTTVRVKPIISSAVTEEPEIAVGMTIAPAETSTSSPLESSSSGWPTWLTVMLIIAGVLLLLCCVYYIAAACYRRSKKLSCSKRRQVTAVDPNKPSSGTVTVVGVNPAKKASPQDLNAGNRGGLIEFV